jgi:sortase A
MPGQGQLVYIAGHRTTYLAPFAHIDSLRKGDRVTLRMPYATFVYAVTGHVIVDAHDLSVLASHNREQVALQACHPRFFATHRYIVWAKPVSVTLRNGDSYRPASTSAAAG